MSRAAKQFWVIDTDTPGMSHGQFSASGPYRSKRAAEEFIRADVSHLLEKSCNCLKRDDGKPWCNPLHIVEVICTVQPRITSIITLEEVAP